jgi:hypothetical protein
VGGGGFIATVLRGGDGGAAIGGERRQPLPHYEGVWEVRHQSNNEEEPRWRRSSNMVTVVVVLHDSGAPVNLGGRLWVLQLREGEEEVRGKINCMEKPQRRRSPERGGCGGIRL